MLNKVFEVLNTALSAKDDEINLLRWQLAELKRKYEPEPEPDEKRS